jgi:hypothetical protein
MDRLFTRTVSVMFAQPVDLIRDNCTNYLQIVKQPMDLGTVRQKLRTNQLKSVEEWKTDVNLISSNSNLYNRKRSLMGLIAKDLSDLFHRLASNFSDSPQNDWNDELQSLGNEMSIVMKDIMIGQIPMKLQTTPQSKNDLGQEVKKGNSFSREECLKLTRDIKSIRDEKKLREITELILQQEPEIEDTGDELEIDLGTLRLNTLMMLRKKVDQLLSRL